MSEKSGISRRQFLRAASVAAVGSILAACAPKTAPEAEKPTEAAAEQPAAVEEPTVEVPAGSSADTLVYWTQWPESTYGIAWPKMTETQEFKDLFKDTKVVARFGVVEQALLTALAAGTPPDGGANFNYMDYMSRDVCKPIDEYIAASKVVKKEEFLESVWEIGSYQGKQYGLPANECFVQLGFCYNARLVSEAGLDPDKPPETWDDLMVWHKAMTKFDSAGNVKQVGYDPTDFMGQTIWGSSAWDVSTSWGFDWYDENTTKLNFNNPSMVEYFETAKGFIDVIGIDKLTASKQVSNQGEWGPAFYSEVLASMLDGYWEPGEINATKPELAANNRASWLPVPTSRKGTKAQGGGGHVVLVFKEGKHNEDMYKLAEFLTTKPACDIIFKSVGWLPARLSYLDTVDPSPYPGLDFFLKSAKEATSWGKTPKCPITSFVGTIYPQIREQVFRGELTPEAAAEELQKRSEEELVNTGFAK